MKFRGIFFLLLLIPTYASAPQPELHFIALANGGVELSWPGLLKAADGSSIRPFFELQRSSNLQTWEPIGERVRASADEQLKVQIPAATPYAFYRIQSDLPRTNLLLAASGGEAFGYGEAFAQSLAEIGQISPEQFSERYPTSAEYLPAMTWDPTTAAYWEQFNADPAIVNRDKQPNQPGYRSYDFRLNDRELELLKRNGFVVSPRMGSSSFADVFYRLWHNDLPIFISTDAILQAWHRSYDAMLEEIEETYLYNSCETLLDQMAARLPQAWEQSNSGVLRDSILDADYLIAVARSLLSGSTVSGMLGAASENARVAATLADINTFQLKKIELFGQCRTVDFSQFTVRGHYGHTARLARYFRTLMWLGRTDLMVAGGPIERCENKLAKASPREMGTAIVLWTLLKDSGQLDSWIEMDRVIQTFVGWTDSLTFPQLGAIVTAAGIQSLTNVQTVATLEKLQSDILAGNFGLQNIRSDFVITPLGPEQAQLPRSFLLFGQKFVPDSWALSQTVFDSILWTDGVTTQKVARRVPSALDVAFAVFGNDQTVPLLAARMNNPLAASSSLHAERWRDGLPYQHNLAAVRNVLDEQRPEAWDGNIYMGWLAALRELSKPTTTDEFPESMRTGAWAMKTLNTQLASWTQLRHDTVLYAKQSYTAVDVCYYPHGYVEPRVPFWQHLAKTADRAADRIAGLHPQGTYSYSTTEIRNDPLLGFQVYAHVTNSRPLSAIQASQVTFFRAFAETLRKLEALSRKQLAQECFSEEDDLFIKNTIQHTGFLPWGSGGVRRYTGWYPGLFYNGLQFADLDSQAETYFQENFGVNAADQLVADVHTDPPSLGDEGSVLHEGVGLVNLLVIAVDNGADRFLCAGPVLSHYEFEITGSPRRLNDAEWFNARETFNGSLGGVLTGVVPPGLPPENIEGVNPPAWTRSYLAP